MLISPLSYFRLSFRVNCLYWRVVFYSTSAPPAAQTYLTCSVVNLTPEVPVCRVILGLPLYTQFPYNRLHPAVCTHSFTHHSLMHNVYTHTYSVLTSTLHFGLWWHWLQHFSFRYFALDHFLPFFCPICPFCPNPQYNERACNYIQNNNNKESWKSAYRIE